MDPKKRRIARDVCGRIRLWSVSWANRQTDWHDHIMRHPGIMKNLLLLRNVDWLRTQRSAFAPSFISESSRNSIEAGRIGTRLNVGGPQPPWEEGVALVKSLLDSRSVAQSGHALSVGSRIREAAAALARLFHDPG